MSISENPLTGAMKKSMANFTTYTLNGRNIIRSKAFMPKVSNSPKQLILRARMSRIGEMYQLFKSIIAMGFPEREIYQSPQNMFVAANFKTAFVMEGTDPVISYPLMLLSKGSLTPVTITKATMDAEGITLNYNAHALIPELYSTDEIIACALLKDDELLTAGQFIGIGTNVTLKLKYPDLQSEQVACCYVFVRSGDGGKVSNSVWVELTN